METHPENFIVGRLSNTSLFLHTQPSIFDLFHLFISYLYCYYSASLSFLSPSQQTHTHAQYTLCDEFDVIFHSGRRLSLMWSWAPEFPSNEFFYYASLLYPLLGYSLTAMWSRVNTKPPTSVRVSECVRERERQWGFATGFHGTVKQII